MERASLDGVREPRIRSEPDEPESTVNDERAARHERTEAEERANRLERTDVPERAATPESTESSERADADREHRGR